MIACANTCLVVAAQTIRLILWVIKKVSNLLTDKCVLIVFTDELVKHLLLICPSDLSSSLPVKELELKEYRGFPNIIKGMAWLSCLRKNPERYINRKKALADDLNLKSIAKGMERSRS